MSYKNFIKEVEDFPIEGVNFKDLSPLLADQETFRSALVDMGRRVRLPDYWVGIDSRGYLFSSGLDSLLKYVVSTLISINSFIINILDNISEKFSSITQHCGS